MWYGSHTNGVLAMYVFDTNVAWDDPTERRQERRSADRFRVPLRVSLTAPVPDRPGKLVGPGKIRDLSMTGASLLTKHKLAPDARVDVSFSTEMCPDAMMLPQEFAGSARVVRSIDCGNGKSDVAIAFGDALTENIQFAMYVDLLRNVAPVMKAR